MKSFVLLVFGFCFIGLGTFVLDSKTRGVEEGRTPLMATPPPYIEHLSFGFRHLLADLFWLRVIQDFDSCSQPSLAKYETIEDKVSRSVSSMDPIQLEVLERLKKSEVIPEKLCPMSWPFFMLDAITDLDPRFRIPYASGAVTLSVVIDDYPGAQQIFEKAVVAYPRDWALLYRAAYHYLFDQKDPKRAGELMDQAAEAGAPYWLKSLASRLMTLSGQVEMALRMLQEYREKVDPGAARDEVDRRIEALKKLYLEQQNEK